MKQLIFFIAIATLITSAQADSAPPMETWNCSARIYAIELSEEFDFSFYDEKGKDYAWWTLKEGIEDAFDTIANDAAYDPCFFNKVTEIHEKLPESFWWTTDITITPFEIGHIYAGYASVPQENRNYTSDEIESARAKFIVESLSELVCDDSGKCRTKAFCSYSCYYGE